MDCTMCERKKRCDGCKKILTIDKFGTHKNKKGQDVANGKCKKCTYARDSKTGFKRKHVLDSYIAMTMFNITGRDY